jgi:uncharacterized protein YgiM (DUF1202 family)
LSLKTKVFLTSAFVLFSFAPAIAEPQYFVNSDNINVRCDSTVGSCVICKLNKGALVDVVGQLYGWYKIRLPKNAPSYIKRNLVEILNSNTMPSKGLPIVDKSPNEMSARVAKDKINIRLGPNESFTIVGKADKDEILKISMAVGEWYKIEPTENCFGWINKKFIEEKAQPVIERKEATIEAKVILTDKDILAVEGIIRANGMFFKRIATHKLIDADGKVYQLKGDKSLLNFYTGYRVRITGKITPSPKRESSLIEANKIELIK